MKSISICISEASLSCKSAAWGSGGHTHFLLVELVSLAICHPYRYWIIILYYLFGLQNPHRSRLVFRETTAMHPAETGSHWLIRCWVKKLCQQETKPGKQWEHQLLCHQHPRWAGWRAFQGQTTLAWPRNSAEAYLHKPLSATARKPRSIVRQAGRVWYALAQVKTVSIRSKGDAM